MTVSGYALIDRGTYKTPAGVLDAMAAAVTHQIRYHAGPAWRATSLPVVHVDSVPANYYPIYLLDNAEQQGALGFHDEDPNTGLPYSRVFLKPSFDAGSGWLNGKYAISSVVSHEALEMFLDPHVNLWADDFNGTLYALEACDAVEDSGYYISPTVNGSPVGVRVSNFIYPAWADPQSKNKKFDHNAVLTKPLTISSGGYTIYMNGGQVGQKFGETMPAFRRASKEAPSSRSLKRQR